MNRHIRLDGEITFKKADRVVRDIVRAQGRSEFPILIVDSEGGYIRAAEQIIDVAKRHRCWVFAYRAGSAAATIVMSLDSLLHVDGSLFLHPSVSPDGTTCDTANDRDIDLFANCTGIDRKVAATYFHDRTILAEEAVTLGLVRGPFDRLPSGCEFYRQWGAAG